MASIWTITAPNGVGTSQVEALNLSDPQCHFAMMRASTASLRVTRDLDSGAAWWAVDSLVTIYRAGQPYFTGRVLETPIDAGDSSEGRKLNLVDAWADLEQIIYQEQWGIGLGSFYYPRCILGRNEIGTPITSGAQIAAVIDYAISQGAAMAKGTIDAGLQLWPSEAKNTSCESVIVDELRYHPDWAAWLDHTTNPPTFHARAKASLETVTLDVGDSVITSVDWAKVERNVPVGVRIIYESASSSGDNVYRQSYKDDAGVVETLVVVGGIDTYVPLGRRVIYAMLDLEGMKAQFQKSRVETRPLPTDAASMKAWMKIKYPVLAGIPDGGFDFSNVTFTLEDEATQPDPICPKALRISKTDASDLPRELVRGSIEDWMRVKVGRVVVQYDLAIVGTLSADQKQILDNFSGKAKTISVTATNATTKIYKGLTSFTEGEGKPTGLAAAIFAAATAQQYEGSVSTVQDDVPAGRFHGKLLILKSGGTTVMPGAVIHSASADIEAGTLSLNFGPMPWLSAGDLLELQRMFTRRPVTWMCAEERASNKLGATLSAGSIGDTVGGYDIPDTVTLPGGGGKSMDLPFALSVAKNGENWEYTISQIGSSITDGTNGPEMDITWPSSGTVISTDKYILISGTTTGTPPITFGVVEKTSAADAAEIILTSPTPPTLPTQTTAQLLIGKIIFDGDGNAQVSQAIFIAQEFTWKLINGLEAQGFVSATTNPTAL